MSDYELKLESGYYREHEYFHRPDALAHYGVADHPKAHELYRLCYEHGHAHGLQSVDDFLCEFSELLKSDGKPTCTLPKDLVQEAIKALSDAGDWCGSSAVKTQCRAVEFKLQQAVEK
jgi:hypothetical protein